MIATGSTQSPADWEEVKLLFPVGSVVEGRVVSVHRYGTFFDVGKSSQAFLDIVMMPPGFHAEIGEVVALQVVQHSEANHQLRVKVDDRSARPELPTRVNVESSVVLELATAYFKSLPEPRRRKVLDELQQAADQQASASGSANAFSSRNPIVALLEAGFPADSILKSMRTAASASGC